MPLTLRAPEEETTTMRTSRVLRFAAFLAGVGSLVCLGSRALVIGQVPGGSASSCPLHNFDLRSSRYAPFDDINAGNVGTLVEKWRYTTATPDNVGRVTPLA